ncbi:MAG TPA: acyltransferase [Flavobacterium sp.]|nr:acyltransferase [Flavobacterium sp.]
MIKPLTSLRFIFALMVFATHLFFLKQSTSAVSRTLYNSVFYEGYIGVGFFFMLSGFILAYNYQDALLKRQRSIQSFYRARIARILPLHLLTFIIALPMTYQIFVQNKSLWLSQALTNITLTQSFIPNQAYFLSFNAVSWSISDEMFFYLLFPALVLLIPRLTGFKSYLPILLIAIIPLLIFVIPDSYWYKVFYIHPFVRIVDFIIGIGVYNVYKSFSAKGINLNFNVMEVSAVLLLFVFFLFHEHIPQVARYSFYYWIPMSYLIFVFAFQKGNLSRWLSKKTFIYLGELSFGFYMFHYLVLRYFFVANAKYINIKSDVLIIFIIFAVTLLVSHYSYKYFETPMNRYVRRLLSRISMLSCDKA